MPHNLSLQPPLVPHNLSLQQDIKEQLQEQLGGLPPNKLKLSTFSHGVLKETQVAP